MRAFSICSIGTASSIYLLLRSMATAPGLLVGDHKDPFDRMLAAQALIEDMGLVTADPQLAAFGARVVW